MRVWLPVGGGTIFDCDCCGKGEDVLEGYCEGCEVFDILEREHISISYIAEYPMAT